MYVIKKLKIVALVFSLLMNTTFILAETTTNTDSSNKFDPQYNADNLNSITKKQFEDAYNSLGISKLEAEAAEIQSIGGGPIADRDNLYSSLRGGLLPAIKSLVAAVGSAQSGTVDKCISYTTDPEWWYTDEFIGCMNGLQQSFQGISCSERATSSIQSLISALASKISTADGLRETLNKNVITLHDKNEVMVEKVIKATAKVIPFIVPAIAEARAAVIATNTLGQSSTFSLAKVEKKDSEDSASSGNNLSREDVDSKGTGTDTKIGAEAETKTAMEAGMERSSGTKAVSAEKTTGTDAESSNDSYLAFKPVALAALTNLSCKKENNTLAASHHLLMIGSASFLTQQARIKDDYYSNNNKISVVSSSTIATNNSTNKDNTSIFLESAASVQNEIDAAKGKQETLVTETKEMFQKIKNVIVWEENSIRAVARVQESIGEAMKASRSSAVASVAARNIILKAWACSAEVSKGDLNRSIYNTSRSNIPPSQSSASTASTNSQYVLGDLNKRMEKAIEKWMNHLCLICENPTKKDDDLIKNSAYHLSNKSSGYEEFKNVVYLHAKVMTGHNEVSDLTSLGLNTNFKIETERYTPEEPIKRTVGFPHAFGQRRNYSIVITDLLNSSSIK